MVPVLLAAFLAALPGPAMAHGGLSNYTVGETWYRGYDPSTPEEDQVNQPWLIQRQWSTIDPLFTPLSPFMACNDPGTPPPSSIPIPAGETITAVYYYWLHPVGPMTVWLSRCPDDGCNSVNLTEAKWFKIWEAGLLEGTLERGTWYQKSFQRWDGEPGLWPAKLPEALGSGRYMIRHEILSLHVGYRPQFYPECAHLEVKGVEGKGVEAEVPAEYLRVFPGGYEQDDASVFIDIYSEENVNTTTYVIPGGPIWEGLGLHVLDEKAGTAKGEYSVER
ncbi:glycoside hydrolase family 61 protein [Triangularia verruculosa]|uniref:lytic cellulose monooxygenase (C4-dehydrogenating) n=1 Tax=Triangularia verruculosa TaxID=2587418 RepID=A0AAN7AQH2_9PEZI|nr:glycoside hydrolase family 61 protein [Triangularia verruculosa]